MNNLMISPALSNRAINQVRDLRNDGVVLNVSNLLDGLSAPAFADLRRAVADGQSTGDIPFACAQCGEPVYLTSGKGATGDGRTGFFRHYANNNVECCWRSGTHVRSQGAVQFGGMQEGSEHKALKASLVSVLLADIEVTHLEVEQRVTVGTHWRQPDVLATIDGQRVAFEIQLARLPLTTMVERGKFYRESGIHMVWVTSAANVLDLTAQTFRDICYLTGGRIFVVDADCVGLSRSTASFQLKELSLEPVVRAPYSLFNRWKTDYVGREVVLMPEAKRRVEGARRYGGKLSRLVDAHDAGAVPFIKGITNERKDMQAGRKQWQSLATFLGGRFFAESVEADISLVLSMLNWMEMLVASDPEVATVVQRHVGQAALAVLRSRNGLNWLGLVELLSRHNRHFAAAMDMYALPILNKLRARTDKAYPYHLYHRHMLSALYPGLAFYLLAKAPPRRKSEHVN